MPTELTDSEQTRENLAIAPGTGLFAATLKRNYKQIRDDRAAQIIDVTALKFKRKIEDYEMSIRDMTREMEGLIDLSPTTTQTLVVASDFDADKFIEKSIELGVKIRNERIKLEIATDQFHKLF